MDAIASYNVGPALASCADHVLNCDHGDPTMFEAYWDAHKYAHVQNSYANERLSYFVENKGYENGIWFVHAGLEDAIREIHSFVGNAIVADRCIVVGNGSTQLFQAAVYALSSPGSGRSTAVVAEVPYYSAYPVAIDLLQSRLFHWAGDAKDFYPSNDEPFIELVTSPNNPCGSLRKEVLESSNNSSPVHDLAYYWPIFTPITAAADHDVMLFTLSKCTGHGGSRLGWAIVKDIAVAKKMGQFIEINTIGVSQDAQVRGAGLIRATMNGYVKYHQGYEYQSLKAVAYLSNDVEHDVSIEGLLASGKFFHYGKAIMEARWKAVRNALSGSKSFSTVPVVTDPVMCTFLGTDFSTNAAFIWLKCTDGEDCQKVLRVKGILARGGEAFGASANYARLSLVDRQPAVDVLIHRLSCLG